MAAMTIEEQAKVIMALSTSAHLRYDEVLNRLRMDDLLNDAGIILRARGFDAGWDTAKRPNERVFCIERNEGDIWYVELYEGEVIAYMRNAERPNRDQSIRTLIGLDPLSSSETAARFLEHLVGQAVPSPYGSPLI